MDKSDGERRNTASGVSGTRVKSPAKITESVEQSVRKKVTPSTPNSSYRSPVKSSNSKLTPRSEISARCDDTESVLSSETEGPDTHSNVSDSSETGGPDSEQALSDGEDVMVYHDERLRGMVMKEGKMEAFVADNLNEQIKLSSPNQSAASHSSRRSSMSGIFSESPPIDPKVVTEVEDAAKKLAASVNDMLNQLQTSLHKMSAITVGCIQTKKSSIDKTLTQVDNNTKLLYTLIARCEKLHSQFKNMYPVAEQIHDIMRILDMFESELHIHKPAS